MKLTTNNILSVIELDKDGVPYEYHVIMKSHLVSDSRTYVNYDENGRTTVANYPLTDSPRQYRSLSATLSAMADGALKL